MNLYKLEVIVKDVLERFPDTRNDDFKLVYAVYREINFFHTTKELFCEIMLNHKEYELPAFESITRARRKVQKLHPELANKKVQKERFNKTSEYIDFALDGYNSSFIKMVDFKN